VTAPRREEGRAGPRERDPLHEGVTRFGERRARWRREEGRALGVALSVVGLGWLVVVPALLGIFAGRWLDLRFGTGVTFRAGLGLAGLVLGCVAAWRRISRRREARK
jgi:ATP synthase protein I